MRKDKAYRGFEQKEEVMSLPPAPPRVNNKLNFKEILS
jgi:hypothetical protein